MFFDDLPVGYTFQTGARTLPLEDIVAFAKQWDPQPFHLDQAAAEASPYQGIIASGFHTILTAFVLTLQSEVWSDSSMGSPGMKDIRWILPVRPGDTLRVVAEVVGSRVSASRSDRGITEIRYDVHNQSGETVAQYQATHILRKRP
jgi:acyl dehydratase